MAASQEQEQLLWRKQSSLLCQGDLYEAAPHGPPDTSTSVRGGWLQMARAPRAGQTSRAGSLQGPGTAAHRVPRPRPHWLVSVVTGLDTLKRTQIHKLLARVGLCDGRADIVGDEVACLCLPISSSGRR